MFGILLLQFLFQYILQFEGDVRILAGITVDILGRKVAHVLLVFAPRSNQLVDVDGLVVQIDFRQIVHVMAKFGLKHVMGEHGVEKFALHPDSVILEDNHIVLDVLSHLHGFFIFEERAELVYNF